MFVPAGRQLRTQGKHKKLEKKILKKTNIQTTFPYVLLFCFVFRLVKTSTLQGKFPFAFVEEGLS